MNDEGFLPLELLQRFVAGVVIALTLLLAHRVSMGQLQRSSGTKDDAKNDAKNEETPASNDEPNHALRLANVGHVLGIFLIAGSLVAGGTRGEGWRSDARWLALLAAAAGVLFAATGRLGTMLLVRSRLAFEVGRGNIAAGVAAGGHYIATAIIIASSIGGQGLKELGISVTFFFLAQLTLHLFVMLFRAVTTYDDQEEVLGENVAAAISYAGITIGLAIIIGHAVDGTFLGWIPSLKGYARALAYCVSLYVVRQFIVQVLIMGFPLALRGGRLDAAIGRHRDVGLASLEAAAYIGTALLLRQVS